MRTGHRWLLVVVCIVVAGCVTVQRRGEQALYEGRYDEAIHLFHATLAEHPDRLDARLGPGIALYSAGALPDAALPPAEMLAPSPAEGTAVLYPGLRAIQQREDSAVAEHPTGRRHLV